MTLCSFRSKYEVPVRTVLPQRCDNGRRAIKHMTANVCGVHYRRLMSLHEMELHDGELIARHDRWPESVTVIRDRDEYV